MRFKSGVIVLFLSVAAIPATAHEHSNTELPSNFIDGALVGDVSIEDCTLSGGTKTTCYRLTVAGAPADDTSPVGPFCPATIESSAEEGGKWIDGKGTVYEVSGEFIANLANLYNDDNWQMYDPETGKVTVIDGAEGCRIAGDPKADPGYNNFCLECPLSEIDGGVHRTVLIPTQPIPLDSAQKIRGRDNIGVAVNGVLIGPPAPLQLILGSYTLGVFDNCGGHTNPLEGYHYHAAVGCAEIGEQADGHASLMGYAVDGYAIYARTDAQGNKAEGLDECGGQSDAIRGYHYHAAHPGLNQIIGCYKGEQGGFVE